MSLETTLPTKSTNQGPIMLATRSRLPSVIDWSFALPALAPATQSCFSAYPRRSRRRVFACITTRSGYLCGSTVYPVASLLAVLTNAPSRQHTPHRTEDSYTMKMIRMSFTLAALLFLEASPLVAQIPASELPRPGPVTGLDGSDD